MNPKEFFGAGVSPANPALWACAVSLMLLAAGFALSPALFAMQHLSDGVGTHHLLALDGKWYLDIARHGYRWNPAWGVRPRHYENVAFFPLFPLLERGLAALAGSSAPDLMILLGLIFGLWSNLAFAGFARSVLPAAQAGWATLCFACWPASCFLVMGYPVGLINLCAISALHRYSQGRLWQAAIWCGIGTAAAPGMVFVAAALGLHLAVRQLQRGNLGRGLVRCAGFGLVAFSGLFGFMAYQLARFHDPFAFMKAQAAWGSSPAFLQHLARLVDPAWYAMVVWFAWYMMARLAGFEVPHRFAKPAFVNLEFQFVIDFLALALAILILTKSSLRGAAPIALAGWFVIIGYLWFMATTSNYLVDGIRLIYPAVVIFLGLGKTMGRSGFLRYGILGTLVSLSVLETALVAAGYAII